MEITFWGTRGSIASPGPHSIIYGGNTTCLEVTLDSDRKVIIDSGTGIRRLGDALLQRNEPLDLRLILTHVHWDHILGFPFFGPLFGAATRITVEGWKRGMEALKYVFSNEHVDGTWPVKFEDLKAAIQPSPTLGADQTEIDGTRLEFHPLQHPQGGVGVKFIEDSGVFVFLTDNELREDGWKGCRYLDYVKFCEGADLLVHDCQYLPEEIEIRRGWGHSDLNTVAKLAMDASVKKLILFHHDPWRKDHEVSDMVVSCKKIFVEAGVSIDVEAAREGATLKV